MDNRKQSLDKPTKKRERDTSRESPEERRANRERANLRNLRRYTQKEEDTHIFTDDNSKGFRVKYNKQTKECSVTDIYGHSIPISTDGMVPQNNSEHYLAVYDRITQAITIYDTQNGGISLTSHIDHVDGLHLTSSSPQSTQDIPDLNQTLNQSSSQQEVPSNSQGESQDNSPHQRKNKGKSRVVELSTNAQMTTDENHAQQLVIEEELNYHLRQNTGTSYIEHNNMRVDYSQFAETKDSSQERPRTYDAWLQTDEGKDPNNFKPVRSPGRNDPQGGHIYGYNVKDFEDFRQKTTMDQRPPDDQIKKGPLDKVIYGQQKGTGKGPTKWTSADPNIQKKLEIHLKKDKQKKAKDYEEAKKDDDKYESILKDKRDKRAKYVNKIKEDPEKNKYFMQADRDRAIKRQKKMKNPVEYQAYLDRRFDKYQTRYNRARRLLTKKLEKAQTTNEQQQYQKEIANLDTNWQKFQKKHQRSTQKLKNLLQTQEQHQSSLEQDTPSHFDFTQEDTQEQLQIDIGDQTTSYIEESRESYDLNDLLNTILGTNDPFDPDINQWD